MFGTLAQPLLLLVALGFGPIYAKAGGGNYLDFLAPGVIAMGVLFTSVFSGIEIIWDRQFGFLKETLVAPVSRLKIMAGRTLGGATVAVIQGTLILMITLLLGFRPYSFWMIPLAFVFMILIAFIFTALGTAIASVLEDMQGFHFIMNFIVMPIFFLSGALFPLEGLPGAIGIVTKIDPLAYGVDGLRGALSNAAHFGMVHDLAVLSVIAVVFLVIGSYLFSKIQV